MGKLNSPSVKEEALAYPTLKAAAKAGGLTRQTLAKHLGDIPHRKLGRRVIITRTALQRWLEGHDAEAA